MSKNNLDKLFQEKLANFQETPDDKVWNSIAASLDNKKQSRKVFPIWWKAAGIAAVLAILFFAINPLLNTEQDYPVITDVEQNDTQLEDGNTPNANKEATGITANEKAPNQTATKETGPGVEHKTTPAPHGTEIDLATTKNPTKNKLSPNKRESQSLEKTSKVTKEESRQNDSNAQGLAANEDKESPTANKKQDLAFQSHKKTNEKENNPPQTATEQNSSNKKSIFDEIEHNEILTAESEKGGKWSAGPSVAPVYFNGMGQGSPINSILASNSKTGNVTLSFGVTVAYEISKKLSLRSGVHKVDFGYNTNDVSFTSSFNASSGNQLKNIDYSQDSQSIILNDPSAQDSPTKQGALFAPDVTGKNPTRLGTMGQQFGYIEVPLELNYALLDHKFGVNLIGGLSSLFLMDNLVILKSNGQTTEVGEANNINNVNFSTNVGLGLHYKFTPKLRFNVEPVFKYQLNTFSDTSGSFNPYSLGVYSGFSLKF
ncbi:hypothetical protein EHW67_07045 [Arenibacter aquaticus]|uniref:Uncharacterized protein n=1 Tax=Arenibacter aquaticus TaxID=2489054 RepID=A0A3S0B0N1_9FLAO|nr:outer membrane beta-barrel protein [Arenibacter aquaticus]RTE54911.1 hypothetical protein EHW67_07045 [Arenibacter aquaticus]